MPSSTPAASPRLRRRPSPWPPHRHRNPASELTSTAPRRQDHALHPGPYPPGLSRLSAYGASTTGSLSLHLLTSLDEPAPSGSSGTSRRCRGCFPPSPAFPRSGCPQLHQTAATARRRRSLTSTRLHGASWRTSATLKMPMSRAVLGADNSDVASRRPRVGLGGTVPMAWSLI
jgi:hypothetical protein